LRLPPLSWETRGEAGLPGAHVLAVVPAHRGYVAEVRGRCWLQISSRNALQKQRQTRVNGSLGGTLFRVISGLGSSKNHRDSVQWRPKATTWRQGPGWRHERHSAALVSRERIGSRASLGVGSEDPACQGREHRKGPHGWKLLWVTEVGPLHGWDGTSSLGGHKRAASAGRHGRVGSGGSGVYDGSDRGDIPGQAKNLQDAPKRVWRRETLHILEGRVSLRPNAVRRGG